MTAGMCVGAAATLVAALQLVQVLSAEVCSPTKSDSLMQIGQTKRKAVVDTAAESSASAGESSNIVTHGEAGFITKEQWCMQRDSAKFGNCWKAKPPSNTSACTADSGTTVCRCADSVCGINQLNASTPTTGRCAEKWIFVRGGTDLAKKNGTVLDVAGKSEEVFCKDMVRNDQWAALHRVRLRDDPPETSDSSYWGCWYPNTWHNGKCRRRVRYIGESCWPSSFGAGRCEGSIMAYREYATACYKGTCVPFAWARERVPCRCAWVGWNVIVACSAADGTCGGHGCVWNSQDGKKYCDWATTQNW